MNNKSIWKREPAQLLGLIYAAVVLVATTLGTTQAQLADDANWKELLLILAATIIPILQGKNTREKVYSPATYEAVTGRGN